MNSPRNVATRHMSAGSTSGRCSCNQLLHFTSQVVAFVEPASQPPNELATKLCRDMPGGTIVDSSLHAFKAWTAWTTVLVDANRPSKRLLVPNELPLDSLGSRYALFGSE